VPAPTKPAALKFKRYTYVITAPAPRNRAEALPKFTEGLAAQRSGDLKTAMTAYRTAIRQDPGFFEAHYNLGVAAYDAGQISLALTAYETALALRPDSRDTRYNFGLSLRAADYPVDAAEELKKLLVANANESRVHFSLGNLYAQQLGQPKLAREHYQNVLALEPNHPQAATLRTWLAANPE
jgi:tetratricopeptide (TPR) repeat protein